MKKAIIILTSILVLVVSFFLIQNETFTIKEIHYGQDDYSILLTVKSNKKLNPTYYLVNVLVGKETKIIDNDNKLLELNHLEVGKKLKIEFEEQLIKVLPGIPLQSAEKIVLLN
ncbi:MAG: hypothetical protein ACK4M9_16640 [Anaerobacillus sp.]|uniref:hypothetical protein n=1 Tax=Anaerobacillus sp. TaxID=1872506 RepID=UPI003919EA13